MANNPIDPQAITGITSFLLHIDWSDPWLWGLIAFHFLTGFSTCVSIIVQFHNLQIFLFCFYLIIVYASENINEWAANNYKLFSREQYFDDHGLFISILLSIPLLLNSLVFLCVWLHQVYHWLIKAKQAKLRYKKGEQKKREELVEGEDRVKEWMNKKED